jgi:hypothetical protein
MRKMLINGNPYLWMTLSYEQPDGMAGGSLMVAYPENEPDAPLFLIEDNGTNPLAGFSYANWLPAHGVSFVDRAAEEPVTWETRLCKSRRLAIEELKRLTEYVAANSPKRWHPVDNHVYYMDVGTVIAEAIDVANRRIKEILNDWI